MRYQPGPYEAGPQGNDEGCWAAIALRAAAVAVALALALTGPIVGPGPCNSDTPYFCYAYQVFLPEVRA